MSEMCQILGPKSSNLGSGIKHNRAKIYQGSLSRRYDFIEETQQIKMEQNLNIFKKNSKQITSNKRPPWQQPKNIQPKIFKNIWTDQFSLYSSLSFNFLSFPWFFLARRFF
jgi:hypothetical protein